MDIISHALAGAATGAYYGRPLLGAAVAVLPDLVLPLRRLKHPPARYLFTHSFTFLILASIIGAIFGVGWLVFFALLSHILLDIATHGEHWAPALFAPFSNVRYRFNNEWEWFNEVWYFGAYLTLLWSAAWLLFS